MAYIVALVFNDLARLENGDEQSRLPGLNIEALPDLSCTERGGAWGVYFATSSEIGLGHGVGVTSAGRAWAALRPGYVWRYLAVEAPDLISVHGFWFDSVFLRCSWLYLYQSH